MTPAAGMAAVVLTVLPFVMRILLCDPAALAMNNTKLVSEPLSTVICPEVPVELPRTSQLLTDSAAPFCMPNEPLATFPTVRLPTTFHGLVPTG